MAKTEQIVALRLVGAPDPFWPRELRVNKALSFAADGRDRTITRIDQIGRSHYRLTFATGAPAELVNCPLVVIFEEPEPCQPTSSDAVGMADE